MNKIYKSLVKLDDKLKFIIEFYYKDIYLNSCVEILSNEIFNIIIKYNCKFVEIHNINSFILSGFIAREKIFKNNYIDINPFSLKSDFHNGKKVWIQNNKIIDYNKLLIIKYSEHYLSLVDKIIIEDIDYKNIKTDFFKNEIDYISDIILSYDTVYSRKKKLKHIFY